MLTILFWGGGGGGGGGGNTILGHVHLEDLKMALENMALNSLKWPLNKNIKVKILKFPESLVETEQTQLRQYRPSTDVTKTYQLEEQIFTCFNFRAILGHVHLENMALNSLKWPLNQKC